MYEYGLQTLLKIKVNRGMLHLKPLDNFQIKAPGRKGFLG